LSKPSTLNLLKHGLELHRAGNLAEAGVIYRQVLAGDPVNSDAMHLLGLVCAKAHEVENAVDLIRRAIALDSYNPIYHANLGNVLKDSRRFTEAVDEYRRALELHPDYAEVHNNLGYALQAIGRTEEAVDEYRRAVALNAGNYRPHFNLGYSLLLAGRIEDAIAPFRRTVALNPDMGEAWEHLGYALQRLGRNSDAEACFRRCAQINPTSANAIEALAFVLQHQGRIREALSAYTRAIELRPDRPDAYLHAADLIEREQRLLEALAYSRRALEVSPDSVSAEASVLWHAQKLCDWTTTAMYTERVLRDLVREPEAGTPFQLLSVPGASREALLHVARAYASKVRLQKHWVHSPPRFGQASRIRVGYLSSDFHEHATAYLTAELFELHDRRGFEVFLYSYGRDDGSPMRDRLRNSGDHFIDLAELSHDAAARRIYENEIQILIDLKGYTTGSRPQIASCRPAPIQINWLGFPGSMGADWIDYLVADPCVVPPEHDGEYSERVVRLPHCYQSNDRRRPTGRRQLTREACGLRGSDFVFCCFNQSYKITLDVFQIWMRLLNAVAGSVLWLLDDIPPARTNLSAQAAREGVDPERLVFAPYRPLEEHLARYALADLALDTFPYTSHTTASDALWLGCPLVTMIGETFASRVAASLLRNAGLSQLVTTCSREYEDIARSLARDATRLEALRHRLTADRAALPLFDSPGFARNLESAYQRMWACFAGGAAPEPFDVSAD